MNYQYKRSDRNDFADHSLDEIEDLPTTVTARSWFADQVSKTSEED